MFEKLVAIEPVSLIPSAEEELHAYAKEVVLYCWVSVKQFSRNDTATACQDWLRVPG